ncbi:hypothetical protein INT48_003007 [Thamnidium elegans]|uniref:Uncharacterized protein n=1 Tax=Thamnidium elegans TaxID=101142 RepID=A0A8H7SHH3_9FUNG|nr:hypothetical protein INT48_003007 [Thamnidium elegans]
MRIESAISLLEHVIRFTQEYNVAEKSYLKNAALVVTYNALEKHLNANMNEEYAEMLDEFGELFTFLMKQGRSIANQDLDIKWGSSHTQLSLTFEFISMGIRLPQSYFREGALLSDHTNRKDTVYDVHYLAKCLRELENPIIPNLQGQLDNCNSPECNYYDETNIVSTLYNNKIEKVNIRYHTCVRVINKQTNIYSNNDENYEACTIWYSENDDTMGALFIKFMDYCARRKNYKCISIVNGGSDYASFRERAVNKDDAWIQDPFLLEKNIARGCKFYTLKNIAKTFNSAAAKLKQGSSLQDICDMDTYFSNKN